MQNEDKNFVSLRFILHSAFTILHLIYADRFP